MRYTIAFFVALALTGCANKTAEECSKQLSSLKGLCPPNTMIAFQADATGSCDANGKYDPKAGSGELGGTCKSTGACKVACIATGLQCTCGVKSFGTDKIECKDPCPEGCGNGACDGTETEKSCPGDCAPTPALMNGAAGQSAGQASSTGTGGKNSAKPSSGTGGSSGHGGAGAGTGGTKSSECGVLGNACCDGSSCNSDDLVCLAETSCSCVKGLAGQYIIRADGAVLLESTSTTTPETPVLVLDANNATPLTGAVSVADSDLHGCAALQDHTVWCWRSTANGNNQGQLGNGSIDTSGPVLRATQVLTAANMPLVNVQAMATGRGAATCAVTDDGKLYCWGALGWVVNNGTAISAPYAQVITTDGATPLTGVLQVAVGLVNACAIVQASSAKEVWCWGANGAYQLGQGDATNRRYPTKVAGFTNPTKIAASLNGYFGGSTVCVLDGENVRCLGLNSTGQAGTADTTTPVQTATLVKLQDATTPLSGITDLSSGDNAFCALHTGGTVFCWGSHHKNYASSIGAANVVSVAADIYNQSPGSMRYLTSDGIYHMEAVTRMPKCGALQ